MCEATSDLESITSQFVSLPESRADCVLNGDKFWFFGKKFVEQPTYNSGDFVSYAGDAHATFFDASTSSWDQQKPTLLNRAADDENAREVIFVFQTRIFLLLHTAFGALENAMLYEFDESARQWNNKWDVEVHVSENEDVSADPNPNRLILVDGADASGVYFVDAHANIYQLVVPVAAKSSGKSAILKSVGAFQTQKTGTTLNIQPTIAAVVSDGRGSHIVALGGVHGCGFMYQFDVLLRYDLATGQSTVVSIKGDHPNVSPLTTAGAFPAGDALTIFGGMRRVGMTSSTFDGKIWTLERLTSDTPSWAQCRVELPKLADDLTLHLTLRPASRDLFIFSKSLGVSKLHFK